MEKLHLVIALLLALSCNLDNLVVSTSYGTKKIKISFASNLLIAVITSGATLAAMLAGKFVAGLIHPWYANYIGAMLIVFSGIWIFINESLKTCSYSSPEKQRKQLAFYMLFKKLENPPVFHMNEKVAISLKEGSMLGLALTADNIVNGLGAGMTGLSPVLTSAFVFAISLIVIRLGLKIGCGRISNLPGNLAGPASGVLLILTGIFEMFY